MRGVQVFEFLLQNLQFRQPCGQRLFRRDHYGFAGFDRRGASIQFLPALPQVLEKGPLAFADGRRTLCYRGGQYWYCWNNDRLLWRGRRCSLGGFLDLVRARGIRDGDHHTVGLEAVGDGSLQKYFAFQQQ